MPPQNLPDGAKKIYVAAEAAAKKGACKDSGERMDECAARVAWSAVKKKYKKVGEKWVRKADVREFYIPIVKASYDKGTGEMRWLAVASDTDIDSYGDNMTLELFSDFIERIKNNEQAPERYQSEWWKGGMPYVSLSHYPDLDGEGVPGDIESVYVDGNRLKSKGTFRKNSLGRACFEAVCRDLYNDDPPDNPVRISIGFLDYRHKHKSDGFVFTRNTVDDICMRCVDNSDGREFLRGQLVHEALTRVPVNERTSMEVDRSMADEILTRKDDAASIVGDELAEELDEKSALIGRSEALVIKSEEEVDEELSSESAEVAAEAEAELEQSAPEDVEVQPEESGQGEEQLSRREEEEELEVKSGPTTMAGFVQAEEARKELIRMSQLWYMLNEVVYNIFQSEDVEDKANAIKSAIQEFRDMLETKALAQLSLSEREEAPESDIITVFRASYEEIATAEAEPEEKLAALQAPLDALAEALVAEIRQSTPARERSPLEDKVEKLTDQMALLMQQFQQQSQATSEAPPRRNLQPRQNTFLPRSGLGEGTGQSIKGFARKSVGLEE